MTAQEVHRIAAHNPTVIAELKRHSHLVAYEYTKGFGTWQVSWFTPPPDQKEMLQVYVDDNTGAVTQAWTGYQVAWSMARGYPGAFGRRVNSLYVWLPLCLLFVAPFLPWRRRPTLLHADLLVLLGFSISLAFFNHGDLGMSVPSVYPLMLYLLARMLLLASGRGRPREPLRLLVPSSWLAVGLVFLVGFRIGLNVTNSNVIDVGYAGVIGAYKILHGAKLYGGWPISNPAGDTYAPFTYYAYVPFTAIFGWSGVWDSLPAAHAAAISFDLLTTLGLFLLGRSIRGTPLGITLAYCWAAYPFTLFALSSNSNDSLVALMLVLTLLLLRWAPARGAAAALAGLTKFAPLALGPLFLRGAGPVPSRRSIVKFVLAYGLVFALVTAKVVFDGNLAAFWRDSISYQATRPAPFSIWGLWGGLNVEQRLWQGAAVALALAVAVVPGKRGVVEVSALGAAVLIALQMGITYWFYLYIVWFFPVVIVALLGAEPSTVEAPEPSGSPSLAYA
ncbi:MAG: hypothetical protein ACLP8S_03990 [Solirubrobacteraceae bacterium]